MSTPPWGAHAALRAAASPGPDPPRGAGVRRAAIRLCHLLRRNGTFPGMVHPIRAGQDAQPAGNTPAGSHRRCTPLLTPSPPYGARTTPPQDTEQHAWQGHGQRTRLAQQERAHAQAHT